jgi:hypothetical protein
MAHRKQEGMMSEEITLPTGYFWFLLLEAAAATLLVTITMSFLWAWVIQ